MNRYWDSAAQRWIYPNIPADYLAPAWDEVDRVHNWRNYISARLRDMWGSFTDEQKAAIAESAQESADREEWD